MSNKVFDDWNVQLAKTYKPGMIKDGEWFSISQKINGIRATYFAGKLISRTGHELLGFDRILEELDDLQTKIGYRYAFDGELRINLEYDGVLSDNQAFTISVGIANTQNDFSQKHKLQFIIFDMIDAKYWANDSCDKKYKERLDRLSYLDWSNYYYIRRVPVFYSGYDLNKIEEFSEYAYQNCFEGIMINRDSMYQFKRTSELLKYKKFNTIDLRIVGFQEGKGKYEGTLGALLCEFYTNTVAVGTGMDDATRDKIWNNQEYYYNQIAEIKYKDISTNKDTGLRSLQFPVFMSIKTDKETPDD